MKTVKGFIVDVPNLAFEFGDKQFASLTATTAQIQVQGDTLKIEGGQGLYPLFNMNTKQTITATLTDAMFNTEMFEAFGAVAGDDLKKHKRFEFSTIYTIPKEGKLKLTGKVITPEDFKLAGFTVKKLEQESGTVQKGEVGVFTSVSDTTLVFNEDMKGKEIQPMYAYLESATYLSFVENVFAKKAKNVVLQFPLYEDEDGNDGSPSMVQIQIHKASIKATPTIGGNYKTASTFQIELEALNPRREDKEIWNISVFEAGK